MALSASRVAAFEFLIQFRSAGRGQIRQGIRDINRVGRASRANATATRASTLATREYLASLAAASRGTANAARSEAALTAALNSGAAARSRASRAALIGRARGFRGNLSRAFASRGVQGLNRIAGPRVAGAAARGTALLRTGLTRLNPIISVVSSTAKVFFGVVRTGIGILASWTKFNAIVLGSLGLLAVGIGKVSDAYVKLTNRIRVASDGTETVANTSARLLEISLTSRTAFDTVANLYGRVSLNAQNLGVSQAEVLKLTELTAKAFKVAGGTAREENQTIVQFAQALGSNRLSGDELRAVREQAPELSQAIARGLTAIGKFGTVTIGTLKKLGEDGVLTTKVVTEAILQQEREINLRYGRVQATFADAVTQIRSSLFIFSGSILESIKLGPRFFKFTDKIARSFQKIIKNSGEIGVALSSFGRLFEILGFDSLSRITSGLRGVGDFFADLPDRILNAARSLNQFIGLVNNGVGVEQASLISFGISFGDLRGKFEPLNNTINSFIKQFSGLVFSLGKVADSLAVIANTLDKIPFLGRGNITEQAAAAPERDSFARRSASFSTTIGL